MSTAKTSHPLYGSWRAMLTRCDNPNHKRYKHYGGRGITVCSRWRESFLNFLEDMGERPAGLTLDRINPDGNYCKENCRWATYTEQNINRSISGELLTIASDIEGKRYAQKHIASTLRAYNGQDAA